MWAAIATLAIVVMCWLSGCTPTWKPVCRHNAVMCALVVGEHYPVRIMHGPTDTPYWNHAQAQAYIDGQWQWLCLSGGEVFVCEQDHWFSPEKEATIQEALGWSKQVGR